VAESHAFTHVSEALENQTGLDRLSARGTVRLLLKKAGLEPASVTPHEMSVVVEKILPGELEARGVDSAELVCNALRASLARLPRQEGGETPEAVFERLNG
jgi:hypothetical protein